MQVFDFRNPQLEAAACKLEPKVEGRIMQLTPEVNISYFFSFFFPYFSFSFYHISSSSFYHISPSSSHLLAFFTDDWIFLPYFIFFSQINWIFLIFLLLPLIWDHLTFLVIIFFLIISISFYFLRDNNHTWLVWGCVYKQYSGRRSSQWQIKIDLFFFSFCFSIISFYSPDSRTCQNGVDAQNPSQWWLWWPWRQWRQWWWYWQRSVLLHQPVKRNQSSLRLHFHTCRTPRWLFSTFSTKNVKSNLANIQTKSFPQLSYLRIDFLIRRKL